ncbi:serine/threonine protein kinase [Candidatus Chloroploca sp. M-50]|uniref:non-specific serine/threonine protein kinase n=2 Tax=Candidatus Chloroploca mongolica TaxID=2528176 RepID=A0ABS4D658_9CHLR|nr:serine/threonine protein kinase [Candidatus Chloroploca mongolica]
MGKLYLATDDNLFDRPVIVKMICNYSDSGDPRNRRQARAMFQDEACTLASLDYPAFPRIYDYFEDDSDAYIILEYIVGKDLEDQLTHNDAYGHFMPGAPYAQAKVLQWAIDLCRALEYLALVQPYPVVHHDIKPANLLIDQHGLIRLVDFGTAHPSGVGYEPMVRNGQTGHYGTRGYAPCEQYRGETEPRSDIFALGATLYHLVTDDDPRMHPGSFPKLKQLGAFGDLLQAMLDPEVTRRPCAGHVRAYLETLV